MAEKRIGGRVFKVEPLPASEAIELYAETIRIAGHGAGRLPGILMGAASGDEGSMLADVSLLMAVSDVLNGSSSREVRDLVKRLVEIAMIQRPSGSYDPVDLDGDFTGRLGEIVPIIRFVLAEQFSDFFPASEGSGILARFRALLRSGK